MFFLKKIGHALRKTGFFVLDKYTKLHEITFQTVKELLLESKKNY